jgi:DnaK suppressor protein
LLQIKDTREGGFENEPEAEESMDSYNTTMATRFAELLARREADLRAALTGGGSYELQAPEAQSREVLDFKDMAVEETQAVVDEAKAEQAAEELELVVAARRRLADQSYGECLDCGEPIDVRRLLAMPGTRFCAACQEIHEHESERAQAVRRSTLHLRARHV